MYPERQLTHAGLARDHRVTRPGQCVTLALPGRFDLSWGLNRLVGHLVVDASILREIPKPLTSGGVESDRDSVTEAESSCALTRVV